MNDPLRSLSVGRPAARSVLLTVLGEYVLPNEAGVWQETLIETLGMLGYKPQAARQAIARSVTSGWLQSERRGRRAHMLLTERSRQLLSAGTERIYGFGEPWQWDGHWLLVVVRVPEERREVRHQVRTRLAWSGFGSLGGGLWITPHADRAIDLPAPADVLSFRAESGEAERIIGEAWDLEAVAGAYDGFIEAFDALRPRSPEAMFRALTLMVHEWRKFPFLDPDLPPPLLPAAWPGRRALQLFRARHDAWSAGALEHFGALEAARAAA
ncbi:MAG: phenylacetic acid degradation operon negative regulatory protein [Solirubrobacteraceae bacterium]|jgi:phenylacetic acid degradation operon negative regulatory protein|nr:phenylacetic acid degradation operon negative regulatory protein [Solirubrobacteraceae bacterium]